MSSGHTADSAQVFVRPSVKPLKAYSRPLNWSLLKNCLPSDNRLYAICATSMCPLSHHALARPNKVSKSTNLLINFINLDILEAMIS